MIHPTATVENGARVGPGTRVWHHAHVREGAIIGRDCILGKGVYVDKDVVIGDRCKLQNGVCVYRGASLEDGVFMGPGAMVLNDLRPRAIMPDGRLQQDADWAASPTVIRMGASIGARAVVLPGVTIGRWAMVGAGAVVTRDLRPHALAVGCPARAVGSVCACGSRLPGDAPEGACPRCGREVPFLGGPPPHDRLAAPHGGTP